MVELDKIAAAMERRFQEGRRVLSFQEYLALFATSPARYARDATRYVRDMFDHFGTRIVQRPWGETLRYQLFDLPWDSDGAASSGAGTAGYQRWSSSWWKTSAGSSLPLSSLGDCTRNGLEHLGEPFVGHHLLVLALLVEGGFTYQARLQA